MMDISVYNSAIFSLIVQILIVILSICGLVIKLKPNDLILKEILLLETIVQIIEFSFYIWLIKNFSKIKVNVSLIRYFDWFITTPTMLFSLICFFIYQKYKTSGISTRDLSLKNIFFDNISIIVPILFFNAIMLISGLLGEINIVSKTISTIIGFFALIYSFYLIYSNFIDNIDINKYLFWFNFILWTLYGVAYIFSFKYKNIFYNILDIFSKNLNGLFILSFIIYTYYMHQV
jgi:hypothetical protein